MTDNEKALLQKVIRTLDSIPVQGLEAMGRLLGCAQALQALLDASDKPKEAE